MIPYATWCQIRSLHHEQKLTPGQIASKLQLNKKTVRYWLRSDYHQALRPNRSSKLDPYKSPIKAWLENFFAFFPALRYDDGGKLNRLGYWSIGNFVLYVAIPATVVLGIFHQPLSQFGLKLRGWHQNWWVYVAFYLLLFPAVVLASQWQSFQSKYPFYRLHHGEVPGPPAQGQIRPATVRGGCNGPITPGRPARPAIVRSGIKKRLRLEGG